MVMVAEFLSLPAFPLKKKKSNWNRETKTHRPYQQEKEVKYICSPTYEKVWINHDN